MRKFKYGIFILLVALNFSFTNAFEENNQPRLKRPPGFFKMTRLDKTSGKRIEMHNDYVIEMYPSWKTCLSSTNPNYYQSIDDWTFECYDCVVQLELTAGSNDGGHNTDTSSLSDYHSTSRPLGNINYPQNTNLSVNGPLPVFYEAPDNAGEVILTARMNWPGTTFPEVVQQVQIYSYVPDLYEVPSSSTTLTFDITSHLNNGNYMTEDSATSLTLAIASYRDLVQTELSISNPVVLESEGASMEYGGILDINNDWQNPHCTHRLGRDIDLSLSVFNSAPSASDQKFALQLSLEAEGFEFTAPGERPEDINATHWHASYNL